jgi:hypothetical protein
LISTSKRLRCTFAANVKFMRFTILLLLSIAVFAACKNEDHGKGKRAMIEKIIPQGEDDQMDSTKFTTIQWLDSLKDFGTVNEGEKVGIVFRFKNSGDKPLYIQSATPGCGCTVPEFTEEAVMPGKEGFVKAVFNTEHQPPTVQKTITVTTNTKNGRSHILYFIGEVKSN